MLLFVFRAGLESTQTILPSFERISAIVISPTARGIVPSANQPRYDREDYGYSNEK